MRATNFVTSAFFLSLSVFLGCEQTGVESPTENPVSPSAGSSSLTKVESGIPVSVTFRNGVGDNAKSDGKGTYIDGVDGVDAFVNHPNTEDLILDTHNKNPKESARTIVFDLNHPVPGTGSIALGTVTGKHLAVKDVYDPALATGFAQFNSGARILRFGVGGGTDPVSVTGTAATGPWNVETTGSGIAKLYQFERNTLVDRGNYYLPFSVTAVRK